MAAYLLLRVVLHNLVLEDGHLLEHELGHLLHDLARDLGHRHLEQPLGVRVRDGRARPRVVAQVELLARRVARVDLRLRRRPRQRRRLRELRLLQLLPLLLRAPSALTAHPHLDGGWLPSEHRPRHADVQPVWVAAREVEVVLREAPLPGLRVCAGQQHRLRYSAVCLGHGRGTAGAGRGSRQCLRSLRTGMAARARHGSSGRPSAAHRPGVWRSGTLLNQQWCRPP